MPLKDRIPTSVMHLTFDGEFCRSIRGCIPSSVIEIIFGNRIAFNFAYDYIFKHPINDCIPATVKKIIFQNKMSKDIKSLIIKPLERDDLIIVFNDAEY